MWQRIQTLYLAISLGLMASMFFVEKASGIYFREYLPYLVLLVVITLLDFLALTVYKHRVFQFRTVNLSTIITIALQAWLVVDFISTHSDVLFRVAALFPFASIVLNVLAARSIWADEMIVRSASRLRAAKRKQ